MKREEEEESQRSIGIRSDRYCGSLNDAPTVKKFRSESEVDFDSPLNLSKGDKSLSLSKKKISHPKKWDKLEFYNRIKTQLKSEGVLNTAHNVLGMVKRVVELKNFSENVQNVNTRQIVKVMIFFWMAMLIQIKLSKPARKMIFKTLYVLCGTLTVMGAITTSAVLLYKYQSSQKAIKGSKKQQDDRKTYHLKRRIHH